MKKGVKLLLIVFLIAVLLFTATYAFILNAISLTQADGIIVYSELGVQTPRFRIWNQSNDFSAEENAQDVGADITWVVTKSNHKRNEIIVGTEDKDEDINIQIYNETGSWTNHLELSTDILNSTQRPFDIAIEQISGDVLIVYENSSNDDPTIAYRIWNGTEYSAEQTLTTSLTDSSVHWISLTAKKDTDKIMLLAHNNYEDLYAIPWDGTSFDATKEIILSAETISNDIQHFDFAWEETSGEGLVVYGEGSDLVYRTYDSITGFNAINNTISLNGALDAIRLCSKPESDLIGMIWQADGEIVEVRMWNNAILPNSPAEDDKAQKEGTNNVNLDCAWINSTTAMFGFIKEDELAMSYAFFTKDNIWSVNDLASTTETQNFGTNKIRGLRFNKHPTTNEIMITAMSNDRTISTIRWNGTNFVSITTSTIETNTVLKGAQEAVMFDWSRYDSPPIINQVSPTNGSSFNISNIINITANVTDNIGVDTVLASIVLSNGATEELTLADNGNDIFNSSYTIPAEIGNYNITFTANDTKNNVETVKTTFNVSDVVSPTITLNNPINNLDTANTTIEFNFTATDDYYTTLNCALIINGTLIQSNSTTQNGIPTLFMITGLSDKTYVWNISCIDGSNNLKISETRNFIIDTSTPLNPKGPGGSGGAGSSSAGSGSGSATGGAAGGMSGGSVIEQEESVYSTVRIIIQKGTTRTIPIRVTNHYENAFLGNIKIKIIGLDAGNIKVTPKINPDLKVYTETKTLKLKKGEHKAFEFTEIGVHTVKIENTSSNSAQILLDYKSLLAAKPIYVQLKINETKELVLNNGTEKNVAIQLKEIKNKTINLLLSKIGAPDPEKIEFREEREFEVSIFIPKYMKKQELNTTIRIISDIIPVNPELAGFESRPTVQYRSLLIKIIETTEEKARSSLEKAIMDIEMMKTEKFPTTIVESFLEQAKQAYDEKDYDLTYKLTESISTLRKQAFEADKIIKEVQKGIDEAGLSETKKDEIQQKLLFAQIEFKNEDYETALKKAKEAQKILDIAVKGKIVWFLTNYWWAVLAIVLAAASGHFIRRRKKKHKKKKH